MPPASIKRILVPALVVAFIVALLCLMEVAFFPRASADDVAEAAEIAEIRISTKSGWMLRIFADGSGNLSYGPSAIDFVRIPAGTYDFPAVYRDMRRIVRPEGNSRDYEAVSFLYVGGRTATTAYTKEVTVLRPLLETGRRAGESFSETRLEELWKDHPPL